MRTLSTHQILTMLISTGTSNYGTTNHLDDSTKSYEEVNRSWMYLYLSNPLLTVYESTFFSFAGRTCSGRGGR